MAEWAEKPIITLITGSGQVLGVSNPDVKPRPNTGPISVLPPLSGAVPVLTGAAPGFQPWSPSRDALKRGGAEGTGGCEVYISEEGEGQQSMGLAQEEGLEGARAPQTTPAPGIGPRRTSSLW